MANIPFPLSICKKSLTHLVLAIFIAVWAVEEQTPDTSSQEEEGKIESFKLSYNQLYKKFYKSTLSNHL